MAVKLVVWPSKRIVGYEALHSTRNSDPEKPETWTFQILNLEYVERRHPHQITQPEMLAELTQMAAKIADPFKSAIQWIQKERRYHSHDFYSWEPVPRSHHDGNVTVAGDAW